MLQDSKVEFKGDHFLIDESTRVDIISKADFDKIEKKFSFIKENNYIELGTYKTNDNRRFKFLTLGLSGDIKAIEY